MKKLLLILNLIIVYTSAVAQPSIQWQASLGGSLNDNLDFGNVVLNNMDITNDGGMIVAGTSYSNDGDVTGHHGLSSSGDYWVVKIDSSGNIEWQKSLGGTAEDNAQGVVQTSDNGFIVIGTSYSNDGDVTGHHGGVDTADIWVVKLDDSGNIMWQNSYGGSEYDNGTHIEETTDRGFIFSGDTRSSDGDITLNNGQFDFWVVKVDSIGNIQWENTLGGSGSDRCYSSHQTLDGGTIAIGITTSNDSDITFNAHPGFFSDVWIVKLDGAGNKEWDKCFGGTSIEWGFDAWPTVDSGYIISCGTASMDDDIVGSHGGFEIWLAKIDSHGNLEWSNCYGGSGNETAKNVRQTSDHGYVFTGNTSSNDGDVSVLIGSVDSWIVKIDSMGMIEWEKTYGGTGEEGSSCVIPTPDGGYAFAAQSNSNDVDVSGHHGALTEFDYWIVKLAPLTTGINEPENQISSLNVSPNPINSTTTISFILTDAGNVVIDLYDLMGRKVSTLSDRKYKAGLNQFQWNTKEDKSGLENGIYFININTSIQTISNRIILIN